VGQKISNKTIAVWHFFILFRAKFDEFNHFQVICSRFSDFLVEIYINITQKMYIEFIKVNLPYSFNLEIID
jgi:hypothetical protein